MAYQLDLDELPVQAMVAELQQRLTARSLGRCDYCNRPLESAPCRMTERHMDGKDELLNLLRAKLGPALGDTTVPTAEQDKRTTVWILLGIGTAIISVGLAICIAHLGFAAYVWADGQSRAAIQATKN